MSAGTGGGGAPAAPARAASGVLAATCVSAFVVNANTSAVSILLPAISEDTGASLATLQWAVPGYSLVGAAVIVTSGALGDILGRRSDAFGVPVGRRLGRRRRRRAAARRCAGRHHGWQGLFSTRESPRPAYR